MREAESHPVRSQEEDKMDITSDIGSKLRSIVNILQERGGGRAVFDSRP
jgi:hypothetical protein